ncbi:MAG: YadA C-terminal domain-containing protein [Rhodobacteraceae bacterium]|nr:YadA C-terminal domain-containing protein [Paracoccaceae bacterium]
MSADIKYAHKRHNTWVYSRTYPKALQPILGSSLKQSLRTADAKQAKARVAELNQTFTSIVKEAKVHADAATDEPNPETAKLAVARPDSHKTIIKGTLEVPKPKTGNEAANKSYVDGVGAMVMAAAQLNMMYNPDSVLDLGFGLGSMDNENAIAVGLGGVLPDSNMRYSLSATYSDYTAQVSYGAGLSFSLE